MAKSTASKTKSASAKQESENVVVSEVAPSEKKVKKVKSTASKEKVVPVQPVAPVAPVVESVVPTTTTEPTQEVENNLLEKSMEFTAKLHQVNNMLTSLRSDFKAIEKAWTRELKASHKLNTKRKRKSGNRAPSGFVKPTRISDELAKFLDKPIGSEMARTDVTKEINAYIRTHKLQDPSNGRNIFPDKKLATLLKITPEDKLGYFNLQKYMTIHFAKASASKPVEVVAHASV